MQAISAWRSDNFWSLTQKFRRLIPQCNQRNAELYLRCGHTALFPCDYVSCVRVLSAWQFSNALNYRVDTHWL